MRMLMVALIAVLSLALIACTPAAPAETPMPEPPAPTPLPATPTPEPPGPTPAPVTPAPATPDVQPTPDVATTSVSIFDFGFEPTALQVSTGTEVSWTNDGDVPHTVTFDEGPDSGSLGSGGTFQHTFEEAGSFDYICTIHPAMQGTITVGD